MKIVYVSKLWHLVGIQFYHTPKILGHFQSISSYELPTSSEVPGSPFGQSDQSFNHRVFVPHHIVDRWTDERKVKKSLLIETLCQSTLSFRVDFSAIVEHIWDSVWTIELAKINSKINNQPTINYHQFNIRSNIYYRETVIYLASWNRFERITVEMQITFNAWI